MKTFVFVILLIALSSPALAEDTPATKAAASAASVVAPGRYDNKEQTAKAPADATQPLPHVVILVESTPAADFTLWRVRIETDAQTSYEQTWAMQARREYDGSIALIPYYQFKQDTPPPAVTFTAQGWLSLEACALRGELTKASFRGMSEGEPCVASIMSVGARRALLPVGIDREGENLRLDFNLRSTRTHIDAQRIH